MSHVLFFSHMGKKGPAELFLIDTLRGRGLGWHSRIWFRWRSAHGVLGTLPLTCSIEAVREIA